MTESDSTWGRLATHDQEAADTWDSFARLPDAGENPVLDAFCRRKNLTIQGLLKVGTKLASHDTLAFGYDRGIKYRNMTTGDKWGRLGSTFPDMKIIKHGVEDSEQIIVVEGETDAARVCVHYPCDVAVQPVGARAVPESFVDQVAHYKQILVGLDADNAGRDGLAKWLAASNRAVEFRPAGEGDWCEAEHLPELPEVPEPEPELPTLVNAGAMMELEVPEVPSWLSDDLVPIGGFVLAHGWAKSYKSFSMMEMLSAIAQAEDWATFTPCEEPVNVAVIQFEIKWPYYRERVRHLRENAKNKELFDRHFHTYTPLVRPHLRAGDRKSEDELLANLETAGIQVVLFDPVRRMAGEADLNAENEVRKMLSFFERLNDNGITVIATHHDNKEGAKHGGGSAINMTGSGSFAGDPDTIISIELPRGERFDESTRRNLRFTLRNSPMLSPIGMEMTDDGGLRYHDMPWDYGDANSTTESEEHESDPPI